MANITIKRISELGSKWVLAPERYDPRRSALDAPEGASSSLTLGDLAEIVRQTLSPTAKTAVGRSFIVLDTSDVREGLIVGRKTPVFGPDIGSTKKVFMRKDVLISRLRPYLRQVAIVDDGFAPDSGDAELACSTEFYVLRSKSSASIGFLVPYLLSAPVQNVLAASQEGGHHPRFDDSTLLALPVPAEVLRHREEYSNAISLAAVRYRESEFLIQDHILNVNRHMDVPSDNNPTSTDVF